MATIDYACWMTWVSSCSTTAAVSTEANCAWTIWCDETASTCNIALGVKAVPVRGLSAEERVEIALREAKLREAACKRLAAEESARKAAEKRAEELLKTVLDKEQRAEYEKDKRFHVTTTSGRRYSIRPGWGHNVHEVNEAGRHTKEFCLVAKGRVPDADLMLTQKLLLEHREDEFLRVANAKML